MDNQNPNPTGQTTINVQVPSADNIASRRTLIPASFALAIIFFFFTFCDFKCGGQKIGSIKGIELVTGTEIKDHDLMSGQETKGQEIPASMWAIFAFGAAIIGLGAFLIKEKRESIIGTGAGAIGAGSLVILQFVIKSAMDEKGKGQIETDFQFPYWGALIALGVAGLISYLRMKKTHNIVISASPPVTATTENVVQPQVQQTTVAQQPSSFDIGEWFQKNKKLAIGLIVLLAVAFGVYKFFLQHDPAKDGQTVAIAYCDCGKENTEQRIKVYKDFIANFGSYKLTRRSAGQKMLESLLKPLADATQKCYDKSQADYTKYKERYVTDKEQVEKYDYAVNAQQQLCKDDQQTILNDLTGQANTKFQSINDMEADVNDFLRNKFGNKWRVATDDDRKWDKYSFDNFITPERKKNEYYPYVLKGDFDNNGSSDLAAIVINPDNKYERIAIIMNNNKIYWWEQSGDAISFIPAVELRSWVENGNAVNMIGDGISVAYFEKSSYVIYWNGYSFQQYWTSD